MALVVESKSIELFSQPMMRYERQSAAATEKQFRIDPATWTVSFGASPCISLLLLLNSRHPSFINIVDATHVYLLLCQNFSQSLRLKSVTLTVLVGCGLQRVVMSDFFSESIHTSHFQQFYFQHYILFKCVLLRQFECNLTQLRFADAKT